VKKVSSLPLVSIIMPIRNESAFIQRSLGAVLAQDYPRHLLEVWVVDGNSSDDTRDQIHRICQQFPDFHVSIVDNPEQFMPMGFNRALAHARGDVIIMLGGHAEIAPDYVSQCVRLLAEKDADCVGGAMETLATTPIGQVIALAMSSSFGVGGVAFRTLPDKEMEVDTSVFAAYRRDVFQKIGGLDEEMIRNQDDEFNYRLRAQGGKILFSPSIRSRYYSRATFSSLWRQYFQYGLYKVRVLQKHPRQMSLRQFVPPLFVLALFFSAFLAFFPSTRFFSLITPAAYLLANLAASALTVLRASKTRQSPLTIYHFLLPLTFAILHISYGLGFLLGLFKFCNRWGDKTGRVPQFNVSS
jgi:cellulose synthase/poly-beta-1,6-N-acetylglucosamine synthase-like glycosyltransferase